MEKVKKTKTRRKSLSDLAGLDFGTGVVKAVRLKKGKVGLSVEALEVIPFDLQGGELFVPPSSVCANYAAVCCSPERAVSRVLTTVLGPDDETMPEAALRESLNVDDSFRVGSEVVFRARGKQDSTVLGVAIPEEAVQSVLRYFELGAPAPSSIELSFLSALDSYFLLQPDEANESTFCFLELGAGHSNFAFSSEGAVMLLGRSNVGGNHIRKRIQTALGLDEELAQSLLLDKSVDISAPVHDILGSFLRQLAISRDFMTRQTEAKVSKVIVSGGMCASPYLIDALTELFGMPVEPWDPFEHLNVSSALKEVADAHKYRFAAAVGAAAGGLLLQ